MSLFQHIRTYLELGKLPLTLAVSLTTAAGYIMYSGAFTADLAWPVAGIFLLACGSSAISQIQEAGYDKIMNRTRKRPIPSGRISVRGAWIVALVYTFAGLFITGFGINFTALILGLFLFVWHNLIYINLKRITVYAVIPGALIGSVPPVIGWVSAGGAIFDLRLLFIIMFFFSWQIPYYWLLVIKCGEDYYQAGLPSLHNVRRTEKIMIMIYLWIIVTVTLTIVFPFTTLIHSTIAKMGVWFTAAALLITFTEMLTSGKRGFIPEYYFRKLIFYKLLAVLLIILDRPVILRLVQDLFEL